MKLTYELNKETMQDCINIANGVFYPLNGFMSSLDHHSVVDTMTLTNGEVWTIPIGLDVDHETYISAVELKQLNLSFEQKIVAYIEIDDCYIVDIENDIKNIFGTSDNEHPGVKKERGKTKYRIGGKIAVTDDSILDNNLKPSTTKQFFSLNGWDTIAGFQTRNPVHKAHEHLQRVALEVCDALFINPLVGWKKIGDFSEESVINGYTTMMHDYYNGLNVYFDVLRTPMRYAGPREAIFHAIIRRNLGCTHFIIGRDHAGVGDYYGKYEAHELARKIISEHNLGINLLLFSEPFYCNKCEQIVSDKTCNHADEYIQRISGTKIRAMLSSGNRPSEIFMRPEIADTIIKLEDDKFIK